MCCESRLPDKSAAARNGRRWSNSFLARGRPAVLHPLTSTQVAGSLGSNLSAASERRRLAAGCTNLTVAAGLAVNGQFYWG